MIPVVVQAVMQLLGKVVLFFAFVANKFMTDCQV